MYLPGKTAPHLVSSIDTDVHWHALAYDLSNSAGEPEKPASDLRQPIERQSDKSLLPLNENEQFMKHMDVGNFLQGDACPHVLAYALFDRQD
jgi:hypothetical protein